MLNLLRARLDRLPLLGRALDLNLGLTLVGGLDTPVRRGPSVAAGLSTALLELVAARLVPCLAAS
ncbi:hypothetical protein [Kitasatospora purpeofusca]|uniref:hypothetical protein n=1 Tax=Kitasatospora purpeofusca TaxID=67352 RepID=UPI0036C6BE80